MSPGPFRAHMLRDGDRYELCNGHTIRQPPARVLKGSRITIGSSAIMYDPGITRSCGLNVGIAFNDDKNLRAPNIVLDMDLAGSGWATQAPPLAVEYADTHTDEEDLDHKIAELIDLGTRIYWVVHLDGPLRVDVHEPGRPLRTVEAGGALHADGILRNAVPVRALVEHEASQALTLLNILNSKGYRNLEEYLADHPNVRRIEDYEEDYKKGYEEGLAEARAELRALVLAQISTRGWSLSPALQARLDACSDQSTLVRWLVATATATDIETALR